MSPMKCLNCGDGMVEAECGDDKLWVRLLEHNVWGKPSTGLNRQAKVCYYCGLVTFFVKDPTPFRPKTGTETLPRPASEPAANSDTLPRAADEPDTETDTLPRLANE